MSELKVYTEQRWVQDFQPVINPNNNWGGSYSAWETYGNDLTHVLEQDPRTIWTEVDGEGGTYIIPGMHYVNRIQYYITAVPWADENNIEVVSQCWDECPERNEDNDWECAPDCETCEGMGDVHQDAEDITVLQKLYGQSSDIEYYV